MGYSSATGNPPSFSTWAELHITLGRDSESAKTGEDAGVTLKVSKQGFPRSVPKPQGQVCDTLRPSHPKIPFTAITRATRASFLDRGRGKVTLLLTFEQIQKAQKHTMAGGERVGTSPSQRQRIHLQCKRLRFNPWVRKIPWRGKWQPTPVSLPGESHGQRSLVGYRP